MISARLLCCRSGGVLTVLDVEADDVTWFRGVVLTGNAAEAHMAARRPNDGARHTSPHLTSQIDPLQFTWCRVTRSAFAASDVFTGPKRLCRDDAQTVDSCCALQTHCRP